MPEDRPLKAAVLKAAVCGASGYAGAELLRILAGHPGVEVVSVTSEKSRGISPVVLYPHLQKYGRLTYEPLVPEDLARKADFFFMALPHRTSQPAVALIFREGKRIVDLSADFRLKDPSAYEKWYNNPHNHRDVLKKAVYGLPELHRARIKNAGLVANPGCYPTGAILGVYPALKSGIASPEGIIVDSKSGASGAGRQADPRFSFCEVNEGFRAYSVASHRHTPEMEQELSAVAKQTVTINFTPHLLPVNRGILTTIYLKTAKKTTTEKALSVYQKQYANEQFVRVLAPGALPDISAVRGTNRCDIGLVLDERTGTLIVVTAIDNLVKGAAGQAVHNMNIMMGFPEETGLGQLAVFP
ncbi:MAG: N-acetyl-gamma-glutamyl-phosphate reductase [Nitrospiraceae bacterium]|nr:N-acetyl-gamma-glutamyl-phosphate reductase [Nitrospiraceae bacterium]